MARDKLEEAIKAFCTAWSARDPSALLDLWDTDDPGCSYLPARSEQRLVGVDAVQAFIYKTMKTFGTIRMRPGAVHVRHLHDDLGTAFAELDWALKATTDGPLLGGTIRISAVLRKREGEWRFCHYAEAPLAPLVELRRFYQKVAADGHDVET